MEITYAILLIAMVALAGALLIFALWKHKKASAGEVKLIGEFGQVETRLDPEGTVIVCGELWRAKSITGDAVDARTRVRVAGIEDHLVLVEIPSSSPSR